MHLAVQLLSVIDGKGIDFAKDHKASMPSPVEGSSQSTEAFSIGIGANRSGL